jgi:hypothetical protein
VLVLLTTLLAALGVGDFLDDLAKTTKKALVELSPQQLAVRFYVLQDPDPLRCSEFFSAHQYRLPLSATCKDWLHGHSTWWEWWWHFVPTRWSWAFYRLIGDIFAERPPVKAVIDILQLAAGSVIALVLFIWLDLKVGILIPPAFILTALVCTTLLSLPILAIMSLGAMLVGGVVHEAELSLYGGTLSALFFACSKHSLESGVHHALNRTLERAIGRWLK